MKRRHLRDVRRSKKFTQARLAAVIGKPQSFISKLETAVRTRPPAFDDVVAIASALEVDPSSLTFGPRDHEATV